MIKIELIGFLGKDADVNNVNGHQVINFNVAHTEKWRDAKGVENQKTTWVNCSYWSKSERIQDYLKKGTQVYVEGQPDVKVYTDGSGRSVPQMTCRVFNVQLLGGNKPQQSGNSQPTSSGSVHSDIPQNSDGLPF